MRLAAPVVAAVAVLAACGGEKDAAAPAPPLSPVTTGATTGDTTPQTPGDRRECTNTAFRFQLSFPAGWETVERGPRACLVLDPRPIPVPRAGDAPVAAIEVQPAQETFANIVATMTDGRFARVLARTDERVSGRAAAVVEYEATGEGLEDAGTRVYAWVVDGPGGRAFVVRASTAAGDDYDATKPVVDDVARSLRFTRGRDIPPPSAEE